MRLTIPHGENRPVPSPDRDRAVSRVGRTLLSAGVYNAVNAGIRKRTVRPMRVVTRTSRTDSRPAAGNVVSGHFSTVAADQGEKVRA